MVSAPDNFMLACSCTVGFAEMAFAFQSRRGVAGHVSVPKVTGSCSITVLCSVCCALRRLR